MNALAVLLNADTDVTCHLFSFHASSKYKNVQFKKQDSKKIVIKMYINSFTCFTRDSPSLL